MVRQPIFQVPRGRSVRAAERPVHEGNVAWTLRGQHILRSTQQKLEVQGFVCQIDSGPIHDSPLNSPIFSTRRASHKFAPLLAAAENVMV